LLPVGWRAASAPGPGIAARPRPPLRGDEGESILVSMAGGDAKKITAQTVYEASKKGDAIAREVVRETAQILGSGVANLLNIFNPDIVVLAGGVTQAGDALFRPLRAEVKRRAFKPAVDACRIVPGQLPLSAGVVGAIATFRMQTLGEL
jgi:glucokinase